MSDYFKNKYRISPSRLQTWDYASEGMYFITICTHEHECYFGEVIPSDESSSSQIVSLNEIGRVAEDEWLRTPLKRPDMNLQLAEYVIMPNHLHGIITIGTNQYNTAIDEMHRRAAMLQNTKYFVSEKANKFGPEKKNISSIIRGFKSTVTTFARTNNIEFRWQERFHDHIIRSDDEYLRISKYIGNNPKNWKLGDPMRPRDYAGR